MSRAVHLGDIHLPLQIWGKGVPNRGKMLAVSAPPENNKQASGRVEGSQAPQQQTARSDLDSRSKEFNEPESIFDLTIKGLRGQLHNMAFLAADVSCLLGCLLLLLPLLLLGRFFSSNTTSNQAAGKVCDGFERVGSFIDVVTDTVGKELDRRVPRDPETKAQLWEERKKGKGKEKEKKKKEKKRKEEGKEGKEERKKEKGKRKKRKGRKRNRFDRPALHPLSKKKQKEEMSNLKWIPSFSAAPQFNLASLAVPSSSTATSSNTGASAWQISQSNKHQHPKRR